MTGGLTRNSSVMRPGRYSASASRFARHAMSNEIAPTMLWHWSPTADGDAVGDFVSNYELSTPQPRGREVLARRHRPPRLAKQTSDGTRQQDPKQQPAHDSPGQPSRVFSGCRERRGKRPQGNLRDTEKRPGQREGTRINHPQGLAGAVIQHPTCRQQRHKDDQPPASNIVAKRHSSNSRLHSQSCGAVVTINAGLIHESEKAFAIGVEQRPAVVVAGNREARVATGHQVTISAGLSP
ncbi:hypothetical protein FQR65_LT20502 [Abscondita terminalis]|nr:hypothetical protein FQR65_LT20502 [Abscondita terminalis]